jgi:formylglycine-generating enzyme required for sulfatase activity
MHHNIGRARGAKAKRRSQQTGKNEIFHVSNLLRDKKHIEAHSRSAGAPKRTGSNRRETLYNTLQNMACAAVQALLTIVPLCGGLLLPATAAAQQDHAPQTRGFSRETAPATPPRHSVALVIGIDAYVDLPPLKTAVNDARAIGRVLKEQYGFDVQVMIDAGRDRILGALNTYRGSLTAADSLLIYYAGHGYMDKEVGRTYWLPVDARPTENTHWISADEITADLRPVAARHILVISDSCYSGALARDAPVSLARGGSHEVYIENLSRRGPSRMLLSSGGNEPVADGGGAGAHSVFADALLNGLSAMQFARFSVEELFTSYVQERVAGRSNQVPELEPLRNSGHEEGSFVFVRVATPIVAPPVPPVPAPRVETRKLPPPDIGAGVLPGTKTAGWSPTSGLAYVKIPPGTFKMGCSSGNTGCLSDESPAHTVRITKGFRMGQTPVTQAAYELVTGHNPSHFKGPNLPVESVTWGEAQAFCAADGGRLPTEAEWEYAARAGTVGAAYGEPNRIGWIEDRGYMKTHDVGRRDPNAFGLYDMLGNVLEWTADWFHSYPSTAQTDPVSTVPAKYRAARGWCWLSSMSLRVSERSPAEPDKGAEYLGFRCVLP